MDLPERDRNRAESNRADRTCVHTHDGYVHLCDEGGGVAGRWGGLTAPAEKCRWRSAHELARLTSLHRKNRLALSESGRPPPPPARPEATTWFVSHDPNDPFSLIGADKRKPPPSRWDVIKHRSGSSWQRDGEDARLDFTASSLWVQLLRSWMNCEIATTLIIQTAGRISERLSFPLRSPADGRRRVGSCTGCYLLFFFVVSHSDTSSGVFLRDEQARAGPRDTIANNRSWTGAMGKINL